jgi:hypothetical protein
MIVEGKDAEKFINQDKKPLTKKQKKDLDRCRKVYLNSQQESKNK